MIQVKEDIFIKTKLIEFRIRPGEIVVTRLFSFHVNHPIVLFNVVEGDLQSTCPDKVKLVDNAVTFNTQSEMSGTIKLNNDNITFQIESNHKFGIMFPSVVGECFLGNQINPVDKKFTTSAQYDCSSDDPEHQNLSLPIIHLATPDSCMSLSLPETEFEFCHYIHKGFPYFNITSKGYVQINFKSFNTARDSINDFYQRHGYVNPNPVLKPLNIFKAQTALYNNCEIISPHQEVEQIKFDTIMVQSTLNKKVKNCIVGSLAMHLNGYETEIKDVDIVVDDLDLAKSMFQKNEISTAPTGKWKECSFRITIGNTQIDIAHIKNFNWNEASLLEGMNALTENGLLLMKLIGEFERSVMNPNYKTFRLKNINNIITLLSNGPTYPFFDDFVNGTYYQFYHLKDMMKDAKWDSVFLNISFPLHANVYEKEGLTFIPVINEGSFVEGSVMVGKPIDCATWHSLSSGPQKCEITSVNNVSKIKIPEVEHAGLIVAQNA